MKKIFFSLLAIAAIASCAKTEPVYVEDNSEIKLAPVTSLLTKANVNKAIDGTAYPDAEHFTVVGYWHADGAGSTFTEGYTTYLDNVNFAKNGQFWAGTDAEGKHTPYYWPKNGSLRFAAYSPTKLDGGTLSHDLASDTWTVENYVQNSDTEKTIDFMVAQTPPSYTAQTAAENVSVVFEHALSWISFKIKAQDEAAEEAFDVKAITVDDVYTKGTMTAEYPAKDWTVSKVETDKKDYAVCTDAPALDVQPVEVVNNGVLVIPQPTTTVTVTFTQNTLKDEKGNLVEQSLTIPLVLDVEHTPWEAGKHYIYTLIFGLDEILINPSVEEWEDVEVNDVPATDVVAMTESEFAAAVNNGGQVRLGADIELTSGLIVDEDINVDLAGFSINMLADDYVFRVQNGATLTLGRGAINTTGVNVGYVARVDGEGSKVVVNSGTYTTEADCTLFYATDKGSVDVYGGYFETNTKAEWKQYMLNLKDNTGATITVYGGTFVDWNPADNAAEGDPTNFVAPGYNVTAVANGEAIEYTVTAATENVTLAAATTAEVVYRVNGANLDGAGNTLSAVDGVNYVVSNTARLIEATAPATISNLKIDGKGVYTGEFGIRGIYTVGTGDVTIENVEILNCTYAINANNAGKLTVLNSTLQGWNSYGSGSENRFENVKFIDGEFHNFRPYNNTVCVNCDFGTGVVIDLSMMVEGATIKLDKCTYNGVELTAENFEATVGANLDGYAADKVIF